MHSMENISDLLPAALNSNPLATLWCAKSLFAHRGDQA
jgi:hypothetical protein